MEKRIIKEWFKVYWLDVVLLVISMILCAFSIVTYVRDTDLKEKIDISSYEATNFEYRKLEVADWSTAKKVVSIEGTFTIEESTEPFELVVVIQVGEKDYKKFKFHLASNFAYYFTNAENTTDNPYYCNIEWGY